MKTQPVCGTILIVDDTVENLHLLSQMLSAEGCQIRAAKTGREAIASVNTEPPDLVIMDIKLPDISGYEVCSTLKAKEKTKDVPVIFLSVMNETADKLQGFAAGGVDYITKPFIPEEVLARVKTHLKISLLHGQLEQQAAELTLKNEQLKMEAIERKRASDKLAESFLKVEKGKIAALNLLEDLKTEVEQRKKAEEQILRLNSQLEQHVAQRTKDLSDTQTALLNLVDDMNQSAKIIASTNQSLAAVNKELAAFSYSVSHDLRAPLRSIDGFSSALLEDCYDKLDEEGKKYLERIRHAVKNMAQLIDDLLNLSRVTQTNFLSEPVDLSKMVTDIAERLSLMDADRRVDLIIQENIVISCDKSLMQIVLTNLLDNAWKFTGKTENPRIEFGKTIEDGKTVIFIRDNGVGFDMAYADKLFGAFQRLHRSDEFPGTGIGLATVQRIINRHGGQIWVQGEMGKGATFFFRLPEKKT